MNCKNVNYLITAFIDGELSKKEQGLIKAHLATCPHCRAEMTAMISLQDDLRNVFNSEAKRYSPSPLVWQRLQQYSLRTRKTTSIIEKIKNISLFPRQLSWKTRLISVLALAIIISLAATIPLLFRQNNTALATEIALNSPEVQVLIADRDVEELEVVDIIPNGIDGFIVVLQLGNNLMIAVDVDMGTEMVVQADIVELTEENKQKLIDVIRSDPRVQALLEQGANIIDFQMVYSPEPLSIFASPGTIFAVTFEENDLEIFGQLILVVMIELEDTEYWVIVDPMENIVLDLLNITELRNQLEQDITIKTTIITTLP